MRTRFAVAVVTAWVLGTPEVSHAQFGGPLLSGAGTSVTFTLPVNLTQLSSDLERVRLRCMVGGEGMAWPSSYMSSEASVPRDEVPVLGGQLVTTMKIMVPIPVEFFKDPIGKTAEYQCGIDGFSKSLQRWDFFSETPTAPAFLLKPAPPVIQGTFTW